MRLTCHFAQGLRQRLSAALLVCGLLFVQGLAPSFASEALAPAVAAAHPKVSVASFNIQFLGMFQRRDNAALADMLAPFDLVFVQELVAPPYSGKFPDGTNFRPDPEAKAFFDAMAAHGFKYVLSDEDTGTGPQQHVNSSATEWFVAFYHPGKVAPAPDLFTGFLAADRYDNPDYERVPYAFGFRAGSEDLDFISVHLQPGGSAAETKRRAHEISTIASWISARTGAERDYVILGDMNIEDCTELTAVMPAGYASLNATCLPTNTNPNGPKPYDHVMRSVTDTSSELPYGLRVMSLVDAMRPHWDTAKGAYPGDPYKHDAFRQLYSDHNPVAFEIVIDGSDDD